MLDVLLNLSRVSKSFTKSMCVKFLVQFQFQKLSNSRYVSFNIFKFKEYLSYLVRRQQLVTGPLSLATQHLNQLSDRTF